MRVHVLCVRVRVHVLCVCMSCVCMTMCVYIFLRHPREYYIVLFAVKTPVHFRYSALSSLTLTVPKPVLQHFEG